MQEKVLRDKKCKPFFNAGTAVGSDQVAQAQIQPCIEDGTAVIHNIQ